MIDTPRFNIKDIPPLGGSIMKELDRAVMAQLEEIYAQREEILTAFIAKYGFEPDRAMQVERRMPDGTTRWFVVRRSDEDMLNGSMAGAQL